jgi:hypothetical protein
MEEIKLAIAATIIGMFMPAKLKRNYNPAPIDFPPVLT